MKPHTLLLCTALAAASLIPGISSGQTISTTLNSVAPSLLVNGKFVSGTTDSTYTSGVLNFNNVTFSAFCVDPLETIGINQTLTYQIQDASTLTNSAIIARLVGGYLASSQTNQEAAAVQWAIWEVLRETGPVSDYSLKTGEVSINTSTDLATADRANDYLANQSTYNSAGLTLLTNPYYQDMVPWDMIPEPSSAALCALSSLFLLRRRRK